MTDFWEKHVPAHCSLVTEKRKALDFITENHPIRDQKDQYEHYIDFFMKALYNVNN